MNNTTGESLDFTKLADKERHAALDELLARRSRLVQQSDCEKHIVGARSTVAHRHSMRHPCPDCPLRD